jgi:hypothetical protein
VFRGLLAALRDEQPHFIRISSDLGF